MKRKYLINWYGHNLIDLFLPQLKEKINNHHLSTFLLILLSVFTASKLFQNTVLLSTTITSHILAIISLLSLAIVIFIAILYTPLNKRNIGLFLSLAVLGIFVPFHLCFYLLVIFAIPIIGLQRFFSWNFWTILLSIMVIGILFRPFATKQVFNPVMDHWKRSLGLGNPNALGNFCFVLLLELPLIAKKFPTPMKIILFLLVTFGLIWSDSRTPIFLYIIYLLGLLLSRKVKRSKASDILLSITPFICLGLSLTTAYFFHFYPDRLLTIFDQEMSNRWLQADKFINNYLSFPTFWSASLHDFS